MQTLLGVVLRRYYCPAGSTERFPCPKGQTSPLDLEQRAECVDCPPGYYANQLGTTACWACAVRSDGQPTTQPEHYFYCPGYGNTARSLAVAGYRTIGPVGARTDMVPCGGVQYYCKLGRQYTVRPVISPQPPPPSPTGAELSRSVRSG